MRRSLCHCGANDDLTSLAQHRKLGDLADPHAAAAIAMPSQIALMIRSMTSFPIGQERARLQHHDAPQHIIRRFGRGRYDVAHQRTMLRDLRWPTSNGLIVCGR
jgi:hypothetical protein